MSSYLEGRTIQIKVGQTLSRPITLYAGTPQGSVLSPTLFNVYVNDIPLRQSGLNDGGQFADDVTAWTSARLKRTALARLQHSLNFLKPWLSKWKVKVNVAKTQLLCFNQRSDGRKLTFCEKKSKNQK